MMLSSRKRRMAACRTYLTVLDTVVIQLILPSSSLRKRSLHLTKNITSSVGGYLPNTITEMWEPSRDFAFLRLPTSGTKTVVALSGYVRKSTKFFSSNNVAFRRTLPQVMVLSSDGYFYSYSIDLENGGECTLLKQHKYVLCPFSETLVDCL